MKALSEDEYESRCSTVPLAAYPPGSVYKMVTAIAAVDLGGYEPLAISSTRQGPVHLL
ncbi:MAG: hypothetical protein ACLU3I_00530 [Acutalibacteraceae bacterium]